MHFQSAEEVAERHRWAFPSRPVLGQRWAAEFTVVLVTPCKDDHRSASENGRNNETHAFQVKGKILRRNHGNVSFY